MSQPTQQRAPLKIEQTLALLIDAYHADRFITALDALNAYGDCSWHSSVSTLRERGLVFEQHTHNHTNQVGGVTRFQSYQLTPESLEKAEALLASYRMARTPEQQKSA